MFIQSVNILILIVSLAQGIIIPSSNYSIRLGVFSSTASQYDLDNVEIDHYFTVWGPELEAKNKQHIIDFNTNNTKRREKLGKSRTALLTVEPWGMFEEGNDRRLLLSNISNGKYTPIIKNLCELVNNINADSIILRWGHEMELHDSSRYPWAFNDPELFINAYRKWVDTCRLSSNKVQFMFSPAGNIGQEQYYPGDKYVDSVGMSWYSYPDFEWYSYQKVLTFQDIMNDKYGRVSRYNKPIIAAEYGMAGSQEQKTKMLQPLSNLAQVKKDYPLMDGIVLFSTASESWAEGKIPAPDWNLTDKQILNIK
jgi:beta-mannanase